MALQDAEQVDRGARGNTTYSVTFTFEDGSKVSGISDIRVEHSETPVSLEEIEIRARLGEAVKPYGLRLALSRLAGHYTAADEVAP